MVWPVVKITFQFTLMCVVLMNLIGCASKSEVEASNETVDTALTSFEQVAPADKLQSYKAAAHNGSGAAANSLSTFYLMADKNQDDDLYWTMISAENGSAVGQYNLAKKYLNNDFKYHSVLRARFWLKKAAQQGDTKSQELLREIEAK